MVYREISSWIRALQIVVLVLRVSIYLIWKQKNQKTKAAGAGATGMFTQLAFKNQLQIGSWKDTNFELIIFDLSHVNEALTQHKAKSVHGIIGADILMKGKAIVDYYNHYLYLMA